LKGHVGLEKERKKGVGNVGKFVPEESFPPSGICSTEEEISRKRPAESAFTSLPVSN
jgi:hypothetical protein